MRRILIGLLIVALGLTSVNLYKRLTEDSEFKVKFHIYSQRTGKPLDILFRTIPTRYDKMIDVDIIEPYSKELNLYKVNNDVFGGTPDMHYVVYDKDNREISDLKSEFLFRKIKNSENINLDTIDSYSIDVLTFRQIFEPHLKTNDTIADKYAELLANSGDSTDFKELKNISDIESLLSSHRRTETPMINEDKTLKDFDFVNHLGQNEFLYWYYDKGIIKIQLYFKDGQLTNVKTLRIGNLGIEITHI